MISRFTSPDSEPVPRHSPPSERRANRGPHSGAVEISETKSVFLQSPMESDEKSAPTFAAAFCRRFGVAPERYDIEMLERCLARRARVLRPFIRLVAPTFFSVDALFVQSIGRTRAPDEFAQELKGFRDHVANRRWLRHSLRLRLSIRRVLDTADEVIPLLRLRPRQPSVKSSKPWD